MIAKHGHFPDTDKQFVQSSEMRFLPPVAGYERLGRREMEIVGKNWTFLFNEKVEK